MGNGLYVTGHKECWHSWSNLHLRSKTPLRPITGSPFFLYCAVPRLPCESLGEGTPFTAKHFRNEHFLTTLLDRRSMDSWLKTGSKDITAVAREKAMKILKEHEPVPMDRGDIAET